jgi:hypothetical protein
MHLWTEYEGITLAGYPLVRLHRSEGRSAFFLTNTPDGKSAIIRLTEAHFDETELAGRWTRTAEVKHTNLQGILQIGKTTYDNVPLAFCVLEPTEESLSDVLRERVLSTEETKEVAVSVGGAVAALHAAGLLHEHIDATNVFAVGESIKLRSDCVRECAGDFEADTAEAREALRQSDVRDLGLLLLRCLTVDWQGSISSPLPSPFDRLLPKLLDGSMNAAELVNILTPPPVVAVPTPQIQASPATALPATGSGTIPRGTSDTLKSTDAASVYAGMPRPATSTAASSAAERPVAANSFTPRVAPPAARPAVSRTVWIASGSAAALLGLVLWNTARDTKHTPAESHPVTAAAVTKQPAVIPSVQATPHHQKPSAIPELHPVQPSLVASGVQAGWHVIAYTYNYEQQAQAKAEQLRRKYVALQPQVFSPTGHAPYFVALGGPSDPATALALRNRARQAGLPRDTYARNF